MPTSTEKIRAAVRRVLLEGVLAAVYAEYQQDYSIDALTIDVTSLDGGLAIDLAATRNGLPVTGESI